MDLEHFLRGQNFPIRQEPEATSWFQSAPMPDGTRIRCQLDDQETQFTSLGEMLEFDPGLFSGKRVLDIGAADGFFSVGALAAGARDVTAIDCDYVDWPRNITSLAAAWNADVSVLTNDFRVHPFERKYDVVLLLGVIYHLEDPFLAMRNISEIMEPGGMLVIETQLSGAQADLPIFEMASDIYPTIGDQAIDCVDMVGVSNFLFPNTLAMKQLAHMYGFELQQADPSAYSDRFPSRAVFFLRKLGKGERWIPSDGS